MPCWTTLGLEEIHAIGASNGGITLLHMATQQPSRIKAMVIVGGGSYIPTQTREARKAMWRNNDPSTISPQQMEQHRKLHLRGDEQIRQLVQQFAEFVNNYDDVNFTPPYLSTISAR